MVALLNYAPWIFLAIVVAWAVWIYTESITKQKSLSWALKRYALLFVAAVVGKLILSVLAVSYIPKNGVPRIEAPSYEAPKGDDAPVISDRLRKPRMNEKEAQERFDSLVSWKKDKSDANKDNDVAVEAKEE